ncbi:NAD(P)-dependent oxidoreductase [Ectothiorhodospiraceae bacterium BW-2]|nr:NAD(P)-dependent oxidoreductase [Ectothiorhodospiraceae bacterium BW-2]
MKIVITGGSGFMGTNLTAFFTQQGEAVLNLDIAAPRDGTQRAYWQQCDICEPRQLEQSLTEFNPDYLIHLAACTDLNEQAGMGYYRANIEGVEALVNCCSRLTNLKRVIFATSMLVNRVGYIPESENDYNPTTNYGRSKVLSEQIIQHHSATLPPYCTIRPTSIWGEWFGEPYRYFFDFVLSGRFFHPGDRACTKTYGYIGNSIYQINQLLHAPVEQIDRQLFYLGDRPPIPISEWADEIAAIAKVHQPIKLPFVLFQGLAKIGDGLHRLKLPFPMSSFRLTNMTTDNILPLDNTYRVCGEPPYSRREGVERTLQWLRRHG